jgi:large subunit ribosomal protein L18
MNRTALKLHRHARRKKSVRKHIVTSPDCLRLSIFRSSMHIYAQIIDDVRGVTVASASTKDAEVRPKVAGKTKSESSKIVGTVLAQRALAANVNRVAFDRNGFLYHGRVKALAEGAREGGLVF